MKGPDKKILLVEDEAIIAADTVKRLEKNGYRAKAVHSGEKALALFSAEPDIDLVLMDIDLGKGIDGTEAAKQMLLKRQVPIVFLTSHIEKEMVEKVRTITRYGYVIKNSGDFVLFSSIEMAFHLHDALTAAQESEERYRHMFLNAVEGIYRTTPEGAYLDVNPAFAGILGYDSPEQLIREITDVENQQYVNPARRKEIKSLLAKYGVVKNFEAELYRKDGEIILVSIYAVAIAGKEGEISYYQGTMIDITEKRRIEKTIRNSEERFRMILSSVPAVIYQGEFSGEERLFHTTYISESILDLLGYDPEEMIGNREKWMELVHPDDIPLIMEGITTLMAQGSSKVEYRFRHSNGSYRWIHDEPRLLVDPRGNPRDIIGAWIDITERKSLIEVIQKREERLAEISRILSRLIIEGGWFTRDLKTAIMEMTETGAQFMKTERVSIWFYLNDYREIRLYDLYEKDKDRHSEGEVWNVADFPQYLAAHQHGEVIAASDVYSDPRTSSIPREYYVKSGIRSLLDAPVWYHGTLKALLSFENSGGPRQWLPEEEQMAITMAAYISLCLESHERNVQERKALEGEERFSRIFMLSPDAITINSLPDGKYVEVNDGFVRVMGYTQEEVVGKSARELDIWTNEEERSRLKQLVRERGYYSDREIHFKTKQGLHIIGLCSGRVIEIGGKPYLLSVNRDITMRKAIEQALRESEEKFRLLFHAVPIGIFRYDRDFVILECNDPFVRLLQSDRNKLIGLNMNSLQDQRIMQSIRVSLEGSAGEYEGNYRASTSEADIWILMHTVPLWDMEGVVMGGIGIVQDLTDRRQGELALRSSEEKLKSIFNSVQEAIFIYDYDGNIIEVNDASLVMYRMSREDALTRKIDDFSGDDEGMTQLRGLWTSMKYGEIGRFECKTRTLDGSVVYDTDLLLCAMIFDGKEAIIASIRDITERKSAVEKIRTLLEEKELLLREVHHRIKNNMLTISSLLSLQAETLNDGSARAALLDSGSRIQSMMHIYDKLYRSKDYSKINISQYLSALIDEIITTYSIEPERIRVEKEIEEIDLNTRIAFPVGLIVNELVSNAFKYAFPEGHTGNLLVTLKSASGGMIELSVSDNGPGLPASVDAADPKSFGLSLVNLLVRQVQGKLRYSFEGGSRFTVAFASMPE